MKLRSQFTFEILEVRGLKIIKIVDMNKGAMTVTNEIQNVVAYIARAEEINPVEYAIIYQDSTGIWDGWDHKLETYVSLHKRDFESADEKMLEVKKVGTMQFIFSQ